MITCTDRTAMYSTDARTVDALRAAIDVIRPALAINSRPVALCLDDVVVFENAAAREHATRVGHDTLWSVIAERANALTASEPVQMQLGEPVSMLVEIAPVMRTHAGVGLYLAHVQPEMVDRVSGETLRALRSTLTAALALVVGEVPVAPPVVRLVPGATLTDREQEVLDMLLGGLRVAAIASRLHLSANTVRSHLKSVFRKTGVRSQSALLEKILHADAG